MVDSAIAQFSALYHAWRSAKRKKKPSHNQLAFEVNWLGELLQLQQQLQTDTWQPRRTVCFIAEYPKTREIHAPDFADRVVHHYLVPQLEALFEPAFIHDSFANRKGKGSHEAVQRLQRFMRKQPQGYFLQLDIHNFFISINRRILYGLLCHRLDKALRRGLLLMQQYQHLRVLCHTLMQQQPAKTAVYRGSFNAHQSVPAHKRMINAKPQCGLAVGNLTSQFFANVYLNELDQFVKHQLQCRYYLRYVDDFILLANSPQQLLLWGQAIEQFLAERLQLRLKQASLQQPPQTVQRGADFLGYIVHPQHRRVRQRVITHCRAKLLAWRQHYSLQHLSTDAKQAIRGLVASYWGHFNHANSWRLTQSLLQQFPWLLLLFVFSPERAPVSRFACGFQYFMSEQIAFFQRMYPHCQIMVQRGYQYFCAVNPQQPFARIWINECGVLAHGLKRREVSKIEFLQSPRSFYETLN